VLDLTIETEAGGYPLTWIARRPSGAPAAAPPQSGDLWYKTLADAEQAALNSFGVRADQWVKRAP
jgi:hypothetical protein